VVDDERPSHLRPPAPTTGFQQQSKGRKAMDPAKLDAVWGLWCENKATLRWAPVYVLFPYLMGTPFTFFDRRPASAAAPVRNLQQLGHGVGSDKEPRIQKSHSWKDRLSGRPADRISLRQQPADQLFLLYVMSPFPYRALR
jgi:hypothetical protein